MFDYVIVGTGLFGATFAHQALQDGRKVLMLEQREKIGGNIRTETQCEIPVHQYGPHIFHTNDERIWTYIRQFADFNHFINSPKSSYRDKLYSLPFNMNTFYEVWGVKTPEDAKRMIASQRIHLNHEPRNLEEQALQLVGIDIYEKFIKEYTQKQWQKNPQDLPPWIIKRLPLRFTYDNNYYDDKFQGIPIGGYTQIIEKMIVGAEVRTQTDYFTNRAFFDQLGMRVVYTGKIDEYFDFDCGELEYRTLRFEHEWREEDNYQGVAVINYPELRYPYTRIIEHKHFQKTANHESTVITKEYPDTWHRSKVPYYPINDARNQALFKQYEDRAKTLKHVIFGGRLAEYRYYDMHQVIASAMSAYQKATSQKV